jgi:hypothetical protein
VPKLEFTQRFTVEILDPDAELWGIWDWYMARWAIDSYGGRYQSLECKVIEDITDQVNYLEENS